MMPPRLCLPDGLVRLTVMSGTPETLAVNAIVPFAKAASGRPEGARVTDNVSTTSAYNSFEVCRTFARLHGKAGVFDAIRVGGLEFEKLLPKGAFLLLHQSRHTSDCVPCTYPGRFMLPNNLPIQPSTSTISLRALGSVVLIFPASHISVSSWATTS